ncbi:hypothetical protein FKG94_06645 [Exilibacterium tricleocarpae]|uniref:Uncharacterized protein n=1 Tax=Exilibacterium tricleocarpae TaxID=2591008 RepID=A0A545TYX3_9GAMM|nr:hypothetical protein [Exilibacterium tricleocarpae]TQV82418.1 hypothetical protein FKG94_06645 [Exilibacterium tricleocarpae]
MDDLPINDLSVNVKQALKKELALHELPVTIAAFVVVTPYFAYLVDDLERENGGRQQGRILINSPQVADLLIDRLPHTTGGLSLFQESCRVSGILKSTELATFPRQLYRVEEMAVLPAGAEPVLLNDMLAI